MQFLVNLGKGKSSSLYEVNISIEDIEDESLTIDLLKVNNYKQLSITGKILSRRKWKEYGVIIDDILLDFDDTYVIRLANIWKRYLNHQERLGTRKQIEVIANHSSNYIDQCKLLIKNNLLEDNGYLYGSGILVEEIPSIILEELMELIKKLNGTEV
jgi:hypothetical protein